MSVKRIQLFPYKYKVYKTKLILKVFLMSIQEKEISQIRLLLPTEMVIELDTIAKSRRLPRLQLIRFFLRHQIDKELNDLEAYLDGVERRKETHQRLQDYLLEQER